MDGVEIVPPRRVDLIGCTSGLADYAAYDEDTEEMVGYSEAVWPEAGELVEVTFDPRGRRLSPAIGCYAVSVDRSAWGG